VGGRCASSAKCLLVGLAAAGLSLGAAAAFAKDEGAVLYQERICHTCHGEDGTHPVTPDYPVIAGQPVKYLVRQMKDIRDGRRTNGLSATMREAVQGVSDEELEKIAAWLASRW
jgi:cytochrome c553